MTVTTPGFSVRLEVDGDVSCIDVTGEIDMASVDHLRASISLALSASHIAELMINLGGVTFCDSVGLQALANAQRACSQRAIVMTLLEPSRRIRRVIEIAGLGDHFTIKP